jgi:hypothetical protein
MAATEIEPQAAEVSNIWVFRNLFLPMAHATLTLAREGTPQNFTLRKGGTKQYVVTENADPICKSLSYIKIN